MDTDSGIFGRRSVGDNTGNAFLAQCRRKELQAPGLPLDSFAGVMDAESVIPRVEMKSPVGIIGVCRTSGS